MTPDNALNTGLYSFTSSDNKQRQSLKFTHFLLSPSTKAEPGPNAGRKTVAGVTSILLKEESHV